jgi:TRAP-type C4-dicarboxylate transport system substrate-binding protein
VAKAKSGGRIDVTVAPAAQLGDDAAMVTALRTGALDMSANSQGAVANVVPEYAAFGMPFLFANLAAGLEAAGRSAGQGTGRQVAPKRASWCWASGTTASAT